jgi:hypothetical protein
MAREVRAAAAMVFRRVRLVFIRVLTGWGKSPYPAL